MERFSSSMPEIVGLILITFFDFTIFVDYALLGALRNTKGEWPFKKTFNSVGQESGPL